MSPADWRLWASLGALSALAWGLARRSRACPAAAAGALFFLLAYAPMLPLLPMPHNLEVFAEHWLYLPLFGLALAATAALGRLRALGAAPYAAAAGALLLFYGARTALRVPDWRSPEVFWEKTAEDSPRCARALANLGSLRADCGDTARAEELYKMALQIRPGYTAPLLNLAQLRLAAGDKAGAQTYIDEASAASGAMVNARNINFSRGLVALARGDGRQAQVFFGEALMHRPVFHYAPAAHGYAVARLLQGDEAGAEKYFRQALRLQPDHYASAQDLGKLHYGRGNYGEAAGLFERAAALNPFSAEPLSYLAACRSFLGDYKGALESAAKALYLEPRRAEPRLAAAQAYRQAGRFRAALGYARRGLALEKDSPRLLLEQGVNLRELGDVPGALESFERSLTLDPRRAETFLHYADALLAAGYREGARRAAAKALQLRPGYEDAALALKKLSGQGSGSARP
jgi:superkiller protein 3